MLNDPKTKEQFVNRMLSYDFDGDFASLGEGIPVVRRTAANRFTVKFPASDQQYEIVVRKPRKPVSRAKPAQSRIRASVRNAADEQPKRGRGRPPKARYN